MKHCERQEALAQMPWLDGDCGVVKVKWVWLPGLPSQTNNQKERPFSSPKQSCTNSVSQ